MAALQDVIWACYNSKRNAFGFDQLFSPSDMQHWMSNPKDKEFMCCYTSHDNNYSDTGNPFLRTSKDDELIKLRRKRIDEWRQKLTKHSTVHLIDIDPWNPGSCKAYRWKRKGPWCLENSRCSGVVGIEHHHPKTPLIKLK